MYRKDNGWKHAQLKFDRIERAKLKSALVSLLKKSIAVGLRYTSVAYVLAHYGIDRHANTQRMLYCLDDRYILATPEAIREQVTGGEAYPKVAKPFIELYDQHPMPDLLVFIMNANVDGGLAEHVEEFLSELFFLYPCQVIAAASRSHNKEFGTVGIARLALNLVDAAGDWDGHRGKQPQNEHEAARMGIYDRVRRVIRRECNSRNPSCARLALQLRREFEKLLK